MSRKGKRKGFKPPNNTEKGNNPKPNESPPKSNLQADELHGQSNNKAKQLLKRLVSKTFYIVLGGFLTFIIPKIYNSLFGGAILKYKELNGSAGGVMPGTNNTIIALYGSFRNTGNETIYIASHELRVKHNNEWFDCTPLYLTDSMELTFPVKGSPAAYRIEHLPQNSLRNVDEIKPGEKRNGYLIYIIRIPFHDFQFPITFEVVVNDYDRKDPWRFEVLFNDVPQRGPDPILPDNPSQKIIYLPNIGDSNK